MSHLHLRAGASVARRVLFPTTLALHASAVSNPHLCRRLLPANALAMTYQSLPTQRSKPLPKSLMCDAYNHERVGIYFMDNGFERGNFGTVDYAV